MSGVTARPASAQKPSWAAGVGFLEIAVIGVDNRIVHKINILRHIRLLALVLAKCLATPKRPILCLVH
jgi:hypothetical protein